MNKTTSIAVASAIGAGIGTLLGTYWLSPLSVIGYVFAIGIGGIIAYLIYDIERVRTGAKHAWIATKQAWRKQNTQKRNLPYEKYELLLCRSGYYGYAQSTGYITLCITCLVFGFGGLTTLQHHNFNWLLVSCIDYGILIVVGICALMANFLTSEPDSMTDEEKRRLNMLRKKKFSRCGYYYKDAERDIAKKKVFLGMQSMPRLIRALVIYNPLTLPIYGAIVLIVRLSILIIVNIKAILMWSWNAAVWILRMIAIKLPLATIKFIGLLIKNIHTDRRLLCFFDGAIGAATGLYFYNPFVGLLAGALIGIVHYELVSVRLLKLQLKN